jgi:hypothetical protein
MVCWEISNQAACIVGCWLASLVAEWYLASPVAMMFFVTITGLIKTLLVAIRLVVKLVWYFIVTLM